MKRLLIKWVVLTLAVLGAALACGALGLDFRAKTGSIGEIFQLFIGSLILAFANATLGRLIKFLTIPLNCLTLGLMSLIVNAAILQLVGQLGYGFYVGNFFAALLGSVAISILNGIIGAILIPDEKKQKEE